MITVDLNPRQAVDWVEANWPLVGYGPPAVRLVPGKTGAHFPGVYFLFRGPDDRLPCYVGISGRVSGRIDAHRKDPRMQFTQVSVIPAPREAARLMEAVLIEVLDPPLNRQGEITYWDGHDAAVRLVSAAWNTSF